MKLKFEKLHLFILFTFTILSINQVHGAATFVANDESEEFFLNDKKSTGSQGFKVFLGKAIDSTTYSNYSTLHKNITLYYLQNDNVQSQTIEHPVNNVNSQKVQDVLKRGYNYYSSKNEATKALNKQKKKKKEKENKKEKKKEKEKSTEPKTVKDKTSKPKGSDTDHIDETENDDPATTEEKSFWGRNKWRIGIGGTLLLVGSGGLIIYQQGKKQKRDDD